MAAGSRRPERTSSEWRHRHGAARLTPATSPRFSPGSDIDANGRALAEPHEIDVQRQIAHGIELEVARNDAVLHAVDLDSWTVVRECGKDAVTAARHSRQIGSGVLPSL